MYTKEEMAKVVENLKEELRTRGRELAEEMVENIGTLHSQANALAEYQQKYEDGHITLDELVNTHEAIIKILPSLLIDCMYGRAKQAYKNLDEDITSVQNFMNTLE